MGRRTVAGRVGLAGGRRGRRSGLGLWELVVTVFHIQKFLVPKPSAVAVAFVETFPQILDGPAEDGLTSP